MDRLPHQGGPHRADGLPGESQGLGDLTEHAGGAHTGQRHQRRRLSRHGAPARPPGQGWKEGRQHRSGHDGARPGTRPGPERFAYQAKAGEKWVDVNLTDSTPTAYEGQKVVYGPILINHGGVGHETVTGTYKIYLRYQAQDMGCTPEWPYCERGVPWVSYWHDSYALHGAPSRSSFGFSGSHGCLNMPVGEAKWIYDWATIGTTVVSHY